MKVNPEFYKLFYYAAKTGSLSLAAELLSVSGAAMAQGLRQLETTLGCQVLLRLPQDKQDGVKLTKEGEILYAYVSKGIDYLMAAEEKLQEAADPEAGVIRIGASEMALRFYLLPYLEKLRSAWPRIRLEILSAPSPRTLENLQAGKVDFAVVTGPLNLPDGLAAAEGETIQDVFVAGERYFHLKNKPLSMAELGALPLIMPETGTHARKYVDGWFAENKTEYTLAFAFPDGSTIVDFALRGMGVGCVTRRYAQKALYDGMLIECRLGKPIPPRKICVVMDKSLPVSAAGQKLLDLLCIY